MKAKKTIFVTGATGYVGGHFIRLAARGGWRLRCLARKPGGRLAGVEWVRGDLLTDGPWRRSLEGCGAVVHLATLPLQACDRDPELACRLIAGGTRRLMEAALRAAVPRAILVSTSEVYGSPRKLPITEKTPLRPVSLYGFLKAGADLHAMTVAKAAGMSVCVPRFFNLYGPDAQGATPGTVLGLFASRILAGEPITLHGSPRNSRDFMHVSDAARALVLALRSGVEGVVNVASGRETTLRAAAQRLARLAHRKAVVEVMPRQGRFRRARVELGRARREMGFRPKVPLDQGLRGVLHKARKAAGVRHPPRSHA